MIKIHPFRYFRMSSKTLIILQSSLYYVSHECYKYMRYDKYKQEQWHLFKFLFHTMRCISTTHMAL